MVLPKILVLTWACWQENAGFALHELAPPMPAEHAPLLPPAEAAPPIPGFEPVLLVPTERAPPLPVPHMPSERAPPLPGPPMPSERAPPVPYVTVTGELSNAGQEMER